MFQSVSEATRLLNPTGARALYGEVLDRFACEFPDAAEVAFVRAPGRVNIIGEHTDYNGLPVMPMAIDREIVIAFAPAPDGCVDLLNADPSFPRVTFEPSADIPRYETGHWGNYAKAAAQAVCEWAGGRSTRGIDGIRGVVSGSIPPGSGLSSSSALVVAVGCALARDLPITKSELADLLAYGERYVGTQGGGMDQAASLLGRKGFALRIDFFPLETTPVKLPEGYVIVVANTMVAANKTGGARLVYNTRVAECRLGLEMLKHDALPAHPGIDGATLLKHFARQVTEWSSFVEGLPEDPVSLADVAAHVGVPEGDLARLCLVQRDGSLLDPPVQGFHPKKRCRHVLSEGARVGQAASAAESGGANELGRLMDDSHRSCALDYEVSCPELDTMVTAMRAHGALGARLTGAGFGGCAVALVSEADAQSLMDGIWREYYQAYLPTRGIGVPDDRASVLFACSPSDGAGLLTLGPE